MNSNRLLCSALLLFACAIVPVQSRATDYLESTSGDFSNDGLHPTSIGAVTAGSNSIFGSTGRGTSGLDRDYFTLTVPAGFEITLLTELPGTSVGGSFSFIGLESGTQVTLPTNTATAAGLLGWTHYGVGDINTDILPRMGISSNGSTGFTPPLGAGSYSFWIQDFNAGVFNYGFNIGVQSIPEPGSAGLLLGSGCGIGLFAFSGLKRKRRSH